MPDTIFYEAVVGIIGLFLSLLAIIVLRNLVWDWEEREVFYNFSAALTLFSIMLVAQLIQQSWITIKVGDYRFLSIKVMLEALTLFYMALGLWNYLTLEE